jgi:PAS domain S-box-containing protein
MSFLPYWHFFTTIVYVYLAVYIFIKNPKTLLNRICSAFFLCIAVWSFSMVFIHNPYTSKITARLFSDIGSTGWTSFSSFFLCIILALAGKKKILKKKWFYLLVFSIPLVFIYKQWTGFIFTDFSKEYYGWKPLYSSTTWPHIYYIYYIIFMAAGFYININLIKYEKNSIIKKQAKIVFFTVVTTLVLGSIVDVILPLMDIHVLPNIASSFLLIWALGVVYSMVKYKFLTITPAAAAGNIISTMFDSLILLNTKGEIEYINKAASGLTEYKKEELKGQSIGILFSGQAQKDAAVETIVSKGNLKNNDFLFETKYGNRIPVLFSSSILKDEAGDAGGIVCVVRDISEREKLDEEILKSKKLESIGMLAGGIAHDFNNLLSIIMLNLSLVQDSLRPDEKAYQLLKKAGETSLKAADLAAKFLPLTPGLPLQRQEISLSTLLKNVEDRGMPGEKITYNIYIPPDLPPIYGDDVQLEQVMQNLFRNAVEAMPGGGAITVNALGFTIETGSKLLLKEGEYVNVFIKDSGSGIQQEYMEKIFDPYFSTKERITHKGMGLGLTTCYSIVKRHKGHIAVESKKGEGTTVILYLPVFRQ